jgi:hypothetical protein
MQLPVTFEPFERDGDFEIYRNSKPVLDIVTFKDSIRFSIFKTPLCLNIGSSPPYIIRELLRRRINNPPFDLEPRVGLGDPMPSPMPENFSGRLFTPASKFVRMLGPCVLTG